MKPTSRNNGHLRSDDGHTDTQTPNPLILILTLPDGPSENQQF